MRRTTLSMFAQIVQLLPQSLFFKLVQKYQTDKAAKGINTWDQLIAMMFCQLSGAESLREISDGLYSSIGKLNHLGAHAVGRSTLSYVNQHRDYHVYQDFYYGLLDHYREVLTGTRVNQILTGKKIFSLDSTTIGLCLKLFDWARFRTPKGGFKLHTLLDNDTLMPSFIAVTEAAISDIKAARTLFDIPPNCVLAIDRGYYDFRWYRQLSKRHIIFVTRIKENIQLKQVKRIAVDKNENWGCYEIILKADLGAHEKGRLKKVPKYRLVQYKDMESGRWFEFLTNDFKLNATEIAAVYKDRWQIELFFKKLKQNLKIKTFVGTSLNAVMVQIWTALSVTLLLEVLKRRSKYPWSFSRLRSYLRLNLMTYKDLNDWLNEPDIVPLKIPETSPQACLF